eukprot:3031295-Rhodomonas_salina.2
MVLIAIVPWYTCALCCTGCAICRTTCCAIFSKTPVQSAPLGTECAVLTPDTTLPGASREAEQGARGGPYRGPGQVSPRVTWPTEEELARVRERVELAEERKAGDQQDLRRKVPRPTWDIGHPAWDIGAQTWDICAQTWDICAQTWDMCHTDLGHRVGHRGRLATSRTCATRNPSILPQTWDIYRTDLGHIPHRPGTAPPQGTSPRPPDLGHSGPRRGT